MAECKNRTTAKIGHAKGRNLPREYWGEAINAAVHILNKTKTISVNDRTPYEAYYGKKPIISHLRVFGSDAFVHVHKDTQSKLDSHNRKGIFIEYNEESKAYNVNDPVKKHVLISRDVFKETNTRATVAI